MTKMTINKLHRKIMGHQVSYVRRDQASVGQRRHTTELPGGTVTAGGTKGALLLPERKDAQQRIHIIAPAGRRGCPCLWIIRQKEKLAVRQEKKNPNMHICILGEGFREARTTRSCPTMG